jgi:two-component system OmpR family sensor kinase
LRQSAARDEHREELEYRETLTIIEQQAARLSRIVDDMFTLARADAGIYPVRQMPMYLDEVVDDVVKAARVLATIRDVSIEAATILSAALTGDEELMRRLMVNLLDNAIRYTPRQHGARRSRAGAGRIWPLDQRLWPRHPS